MKKKQFVYYDAITNRLFLTDQNDRKSFGLWFYLFHNIYFIGEL